MRMAQIVEADGRQAAFLGDPLVMPEQVSRVLWAPVILTDNQIVVLIALTVLET